MWFFPSFGIQIEYGSNQLQGSAPTRMYIKTFPLTKFAENAVYQVVNSLQYVTSWVFIVILNFHT